MESAPINPPKASFAFILEDNLKPYRDFILQNSCPPANLPEGTVISSGGSPAPEACFLLEGLVKVSIFNVFGYERILGYHKKNSLFAMDGLRRDKNVIVTTTALTPISLVKLSKENLTELFRKRPEFASDLVLYYSDVLKLMCYDAESQTSNSVKSKLANFVILYTQSVDYRTLGYIPYSQAELASAIGASRVQVSRVCAELKEEGLVDIKKRKLYILNIQAFYDFISFQGFE
ncbi:Crp/Fnr family transcriptional regulator [bacterium 210820-DFI.6.37]|nr:Crp/Fnr family transcriptional regulator [bacterium 210820-DFI.6.37]